MASRIDISPYLIHFTKGEDYDHAFENLLSIISSQTIYGSNNLIKGSYNCVCFSEAPLECLNNGLINENYYSKYSPFGVVITKEWLFSLGGRPVIYQGEGEFDQLSEDLRWRHMTYDPTSNPKIDFTWEREWRIRTDNLIIDPSNCAILVPDDSWAESLFSIHEDKEDRAEENEKLWNSLIFKEDFLFTYSRRNFPWEIITLSNQ